MKVRGEGERYMKKTILMSATCAVLLCAAQSALCAGVETPVVRGAEKAVTVAIDVAGAEEVKLSATILLIFHHPEYSLVNFLVPTPRVHVSPIPLVQDTDTQYKYGKL